MARENPGHTFGPTDLLNQAYLKIQGYDPGRWVNRAHFFGVFGRAMRHILVDHARRRQTDVHGGAYQHIRLDDAGEVDGKYDWGLIDLDPILDRLTQKDAEASGIFHMKYFTGLTADEIAKELNISVGKVNRSLHLSKRWLQRELKRSSNAKRGQSDVGQNSAPKKT